MADEPANKFFAFVASQTPQGHCCRVWLTCPRRVKFGAEGSDQENWKTLDCFHGEIEQLARTWVGPVEVLEDHQHGPLARQTGELSQQGLERLLLLPLRGQIQSGVAAIERQ